MATVLIVDGRAPQELSPGRLNHALAERAAAAFEAAGWRVLRTEAAARFDVDAEIAKHQDADLILFQFPVHWMGAPWPLKKYQDEVYTPAMDGRLASGDGRSSAAPTRNYGMGGALGAAR
ncbi:MAG: NAD(P)H-dependent oxidoreductase, partial [Pseudomonadota bacterium]